MKNLKILDKIHFAQFLKHVILVMLLFIFPSQVRMIENILLTQL